MTLRSSESTNPSESAPALEPAYCCSHCPKTYTRRDYLQRHELNHTQPQSVCPTCGKGFARGDVLRRHIASSCKARSSRERSGTETHARTYLKRRRQRSADSVTADATNHIRERNLGQHSPPRELDMPHSDMRLDSSHRGLYLSSSSDFDDEGHIESPTFTLPMSPPSLVTSQRTDAIDIGRLPRREDAASYDVLRGNRSLAGTRVGAPFVLSERTTDHYDPCTFGPRPALAHLCQPGGDIDAGADAFVVASPQIAEVPMGAGDPTNASGMDHLFNWLFSMTNIENISAWDVRTPSAGPARLEAPPPNMALTWPSREESFANRPVSTSNVEPVQVADTTSHEETRSYPARAPHAGGPPFPAFPETWDKAGWRLPPEKELIDEQARSEMCDLFDGPERDYFAAPAFSIAQMKLYLEMYFLNFAPLYPIVHRPSLGYRRLPPDLLLTMLCIGTAFADDRAGFNIAMKLHKRLRNRVCDMAEAEPRAPPHTIMTILLTNYFSRSYCSVKEHAVAQIFHSSSIVMARLAGSFLPTFTSHPSPVATNPLDHWLAWVEHEERKRVGWLAFMMDTENAALFRHYLIVHFFSVQIDWPCQDDVWAAPDPFAWSDAQRSTVQPVCFRAALHEIAARGTVAPNLSKTHLWIMLHGLVSVSWTLLWRDLGDLNMVRETKILHWKSLLCRAFESLREHIRLPARQMEDDDMSISSSGVPLAHLGKPGSDVGSYSSRTQKRTYVTQWARSEDGTYSCATAIELLTQLFKWSHEVRFQTAPSLVPWCIYIASVVIWAYSTSLDGGVVFDEPYIIRTSPVPEDPAVESIKIEPSLARRGALAYLSRVENDVAYLSHVEGKNRCGGLLAYAAHLLGTLGRGVMDESKSVLLGVLARGPEPLYR
ncbi:unnamed protein product [Cutaneotrichosporon oleaginosum]